MLERLIPCEVHSSTIIYLLSAFIWQIYSSNLQRLHIIDVYLYLGCQVLLVFTLANGLTTVENNISMLNYYAKRL